GSHRSAVRGGHRPRLHAQARPDRQTRHLQDLGRGVGRRRPRGLRSKMALRQAKVMGIVNVTPDSFSDGGEFLDPGRAIAHGRGRGGAGADAPDVGGESTRPGAAAVTADQELARVGPVIDALAGGGPAVSIDTSKLAVAEAALGAGAEMVNDVT